MTIIQTTTKAAPKGFTMLPNKLDLYVALP